MTGISGRMVFYFLMLAWTLLPCRGQTNSQRVSRVVLANGVRLLLRPEPTTERVAVSLFIRTDSEPSGSSAAVGELVARALFYGNANRTQNGILTLAKDAGGRSGRPANTRFRSHQLRHHPSAAA